MDIGAVQAYARGHAVLMWNSFDSLYYYYGTFSGQPATGHQPRNGMAGVIPFVEECGGGLEAGMCVTH